MYRLKTIGIYLALNACFAGLCANNSDSLVIINKSPVKKIFLTYQDKLDNYVDVDVIQDKYPLSVDFPYIKIEQSIEISPLFWLSGDGVYTIDSVDDARTVRLSADKENLGFEANFFNEMFSSLTYRNDFQLKKLILHANDKIEFCQSEYSKKISFLEECRHKLSPAFYGLCKSFFQINYWDDILFIFKSTKKEKEKIDALKILRDAQSFQDDSLLFLPEYKDFCKNYLYTILAIDNPNIQTDTQAARRIINTYYTTQTKDYLLYDLVKTQLSTKTYSQTQVQHIMSFIHDRDYINHLNALLKITTSRKEDNNTLLSQSGEQVTFSDILEKNKGKYIYVDFWASWCAPCRELLSKSHLMEEKYREKVAFVYISMDENVSHWLSASQREHINENRSYLISPKSDFLKQHNIKQIPRYMLYDKTGKLVNNSAPLPNSSEFENLLDKLVAN